MSETVVITCDKCKNQIPNETKYISAKTYGIDICVRCYRAMNAHDLVKLLSLDEMRLMFPNDWSNAIKICHLDIDKVK